MVTSPSAKFQPSDIVDDTVASRPSVAVQDDGTIAAFWQGGTQVKGALYNPDGSLKAGPLEVDTGTIGAAGQDLSVSALGDDRFIATWDVVSDELRDGPNNARGVPAGQIFDTSGNPVSGPFAFAQDEPYISPDGSVEVVELGDGRALATWITNGQSTEDAKVAGQVFTESGELIGDTYAIQSEAPESFTGLLGVDAASLEGGGAVVVWYDNARDKDDVDNFVAVRGEILDSNGATVRDKFLINETTAGDQTAPTVAGLDNGGFAATWQQLDEDGQFSIQTKTFTAQGDGVSSETQIGETMDGATVPTSVGTADGNYVVAWVDPVEVASADVVVRALTPQGENTGDQYVIPDVGDEGNPTLAGFTDDGFVIGWQQGYDDATGVDVLANVYGAPGGSTEPQPDPAPTDFFDLPATDQVTAMYLGFFGRAADTAGQSFWINDYQQALGNGTAADVGRDMAGQFQFSDEAQGLYPFLDPNAQSQSNEAVDGFVENVYDNLFDRVPEQAGIEFWRGEVQDRLASNEDIGDVIIDILAGASGQDVDALANKIDVANAYTETVAPDLFDVGQIRGIVGQVDHTAQSVTQAMGDFG